jgi:small subunit ribosomal protein S20
MEEAPLANSRQARKRARQAEKRRQRNVAVSSEMRTYMKNVIKAVAAKNLELAKTEFRKASSMLDKLAGKGIIKQNKADRSKSRLNSKVKALAQAAA